MTTIFRRTPLDLPRGTSFRKTYCALVTGDGSVLPIEERLGRRLLRTIDPNSREGREILRCGIVRLTRSDSHGPAHAITSARPAGTTVAAHPERGSSRRAAAPDPHQSSDWVRTCREARQRIERMRRALTREH